jgi:hypothetical protein
MINDFKNQEKRGGGGESLSELCDFMIFLYGSTSRKMLVNFILNTLFYI